MSIINKFSKFLGQKHIIKNLKIYVKAALMREECLDHVILHGNSGLGKTTLATIIAKEMNTKIKICNATAIEKVSDIATLVCNLEENEILFIDEIHRLSRHLEEYFYTIMDNNKIEIFIEENGVNRNISIDIPNITIIGATTEYTKISTPLRNRFGINLKFEDYTIDELCLIAKKYNKVYNILVNDEANYIIASSVRYTPRLLVQLIKRIRDVSTVLNIEEINTKSLKRIFKILQLYDNGLDYNDINYLKTIYLSSKVEPIGLNQICHLLNEDKDTIENYIEPFLLKEGFLNRKPTGRVITYKAIEYLENNKMI